jgi:hypothetical protein
MTKLESLLDRNRHFATCAPLSPLARGSGQAAASAQRRSQDLRAAYRGAAGAL